MTTSAQRSSISSPARGAALRLPGRRHLAGLTALLVLTLASPAWAAVQYGTSASGSANSATTITLSSFSATAGENRLLVVGLAFGQGAPTGVSVTYGGAALTLASGTSGTKTNAHVEIWYLTNPGTGPSSIVASWTGSHDVVIGATQFANVDQATPISNGTVTTANSTAPSVSVTSATGKMSFSTVATLGTLSAPTQTQRWLITTATTMDGGGSTAEGAASVTHAWTSTSASWAAAAVSINATATTDFKVGSFTKLINTDVAATGQVSVVVNGATSATAASFNPQSSANRLLVVGLSFSGGAPSGLTVKYGTTSLSLAAGTSGTNGTINAQIWYLVNPSSTPANVVASWTGSRDAVMGVISFNGVNQTTPIAHGTKATGTSMAPQVTITSGAGNMTFDVLAFGSAAAGAGSPLRTQRWYNNANNVDGAGSTGAGAATVTHGWTLSGSSAPWVDAGVDIVAATPPTQTVAHGLGQTPKALILWTSGNTDTSVTTDFNFSLGFTDGTASGSVSAASRDGQSTSIAGRRMADKVITIVGPWQATLAEADLVSWDGTNFTLTWSTNDSNAYVVHFIAISGTDVSASVVDWTMKTSTGNKAVTGVGFKPTAVMHIHNGVLMQAALPASLEHGTLGFGVMDFSGHQWATEFLATNSASPSDAGRAQQTDAALYAFTNTPSAIIKEAKWVSMDADGFTVNFTTADSNAGHVYSLALSGLNVWAGNFNKTTGASNSTQAITGTGFLPQALMLASFQDVAQAGSEAHVRVGIGASDGVTQGSSAINDQDGQSTTVVKSVDSTTKVFTKANNSTLATEAAAVVNSLDADGFTLKWTTNDAVATQMMYLAMGPLINTEVRLISFNATRYSRGTLLQWKTGYEIDNLGFNLYREIGGVRTKVNATLIAGSGLQAGQGAVVTGAQAYARWDTDPAANTPGVTYWLEDVEFSGRQTLHGPITPVGSVLQEPATPDSDELGEVGTDAATRSRRIFYNYNEETGQAGPRAVPAPVAPEVAQQWALTAQASVKIGIRTPGWYRVTQPELVRAGLNPSSDPRTLQLFVDGAEQAIRVSGEMNGVFTASDAIEFYASGLETPYTDTRIYWLQAGVQPGRRIPVATGVASVPAPATGFVSTLRRKERSVYAAAVRNGDVENWFGPVVGSSSVGEGAGPTLLTLTPSHLDEAAAGAARLIVSLQGLTTTADGTVNHRVGVRFNGTDVGELTFAGEAHAEDTFAVTVLEGENTVALEARGGEARDVSLVDVVRLEYPHAYQADADRLRFTVVAPGAITVGGFAGTAIRVVDITDRAGPVELAGTAGASPGEVTVNVGAPGPRTLFAFSEETVGVPAFVQGHRPSSWHAASQAHDYVIIAHPDFMAQAGPLAARRQQQGHTPAIVDVTDIYDEFSFGEKTPQAIRDFLQWARSNWRQAPRFVVLMGDATTDPRDYAGLGDEDFVPTKAVPMAGGGLETASDDWFVDFASNGLPEIAIGRLSVRTAAQAATTVSKILAYEQGAAQPWTKRVLLVAGEADGGPTSFTQSNRTLGALVPSGYTVRQIVTDTVGPVAARQAILDGVNTEGQLIVNYAGHGSVQLWGKSGSSTDLMTNDDVPASWTNAAQLPFIVAMNCLNGLFNGIWGEESLAEALQRAPRGGAIAVWASSSTTPPGSQAVVNQELFRLIFQGTYATLGEAIAAAKRVTTNLDVRRSWIFFGDPAMQLAGAPRPGSAVPPVLPPGPTGGLADVDGDGKTDLAVYRPSTGVWYIKQSSTNYTTAMAYQWGLSTDVAVPGDYDGDGKTDLAVYRPSTGVWYILQSSTSYTTYIAQSWGLSTDVPVVGDYDGDGKTDLALYRPSSGMWYILLSSTSYTTYLAQPWGLSTDVPVAGDYDGDGQTDLAVYRPTTGTWYLLQSSSQYRTYLVYQWGLSTDIAVPGDYDGDGKTDLAVYRPTTGTWYLLKSSSQNTTYAAYQSGVSPDVVVPGDYDGDGRTDLALYRRATGSWYILLSSTNYTNYLSQQWGLSTDLPVLQRQ